MIITHTIQQVQVVEYNMVLTADEMAILQKRTDAPAPPLSAAERGQMAAMHSAIDMAVAAVEPPEAL